MNHWLWLLVLVPPLLIFSVKPEASAWLRAGRLVLAIALGYILLNLTLHLHLTLAREAYEACQAHFASSYDVMHVNCRKLINVGSGAKIVFFLFLGWIPTMGYVALWELLWRWDHRRQIRALGKTFRGKWASNLLIIFSLPVWCYALLIIGMGSYLLLYPYRPEY